ncbi:MAG: single-stranded DNA-binding protein [Candidatus Staskawiczbacteria bacterium]|nr:single-stranded DNA-binding protein [Candidatus Staskawiczbacteria bacterium]
MNLNKIFVLGNVTREPEVRTMPNGGQVTNFGVATNRFYTSSSGEKKSEAEFHNVVCFGKLADISARYLNKGSLVLIEGRIQTRSWDDKSTGAKRWKTEIIAETLQLGPKGTGDGASPRPAAFAKAGLAQDGRDQDQHQAKQEDIPIIEENYTPPAAEGTDEEQKIVSLEDNAVDEIDVKDIPF